MPSGDTGKKVQVIVNDTIGNGYTGNVNDPGEWHAQQHDQAKHSFFIVYRPFDFRKDFLLSERDGMMTTVRGANLSGKIFSYWTAKLFSSSRNFFFSASDPGAGNLALCVIFYRPG